MPNEKTRPASRSFEIITALGFGFLIFMITSIALIGSWFFRAAADLHFEVKTDYVAFDLADTWEWGLNTPLSLDRFYIENIDAEDLKARNSHLMTSIGFDGRALQEKSIRLSELKIIPAASLKNTPFQKNLPCSIDVDSNGPALILSVIRARIVGRYELAGPTDLPPESVRFQTRVNDEVPMTIRMKPSDAWAFIHLSVSKIHFDKQESFDQNKPIDTISQITSGRLTIIDSQKKVPLNWADSLWVRGIRENRRATLEKSREAMKVTFTGKAEWVDAGPKGFEEDLRPRYLEKFQNSALPAGLFIGVFSLLWSLFKYFWELKTKGSKNEHNSSHHLNCPEYNHFHSVPLQYPKPGGAPDPLGGAQGQYGNGRGQDEAE